MTYASTISALDMIEKFGGIKNLSHENHLLYTYMYEKLTSLGFKILSPKEEG